MRELRKHRWPIFALLAATCLALTRPAAADLLMLKTGQALRGELIDETRHFITFRAKIDGVWQTRTYKRSEIESLFEEPGNQAEPPPPESGPPPPEVVPEDPSGQRPSESKPATQPGPAHDGPPTVVVIPLRGQVGGLIEGSVRGTFDAAMLVEALDQAEKERADLVILQIDSPGGYVAEMEAICQAIIERQERLRIVSFPADALSAAAFIALSCKEMVVQPEARIGAAVLVEDTDGGLTAVDAKLASPRHARQRQFLRAAGRPVELAAAMTIQEAELWWSEGTTFRNEPPPDAGAGRWQKIDGATTVLTMNAAEARRFGLASAQARDIEEVIAALDLDAPASVRSYDDLVRQYNEQLDGRVRAMLGQFREYFQALGGIYEDLGHLIEAEVAIDRPEAERLRASMAGDLRVMQQAAQSIRRMDASLMARRAAVPEAITEQFDIDAPVLADVRRLLREPGGDLDGARRSVRRLLERWRDRLDF